MDILNVIVWLPLAIGLLAFLMPRRLAGWWTVAGALASLVLSVGPDRRLRDRRGRPPARRLATSWIPELGVRYELGVDGISLFMILLTAIGWLAAAAYSAFQGPDRERTYFFMLGVAQTATVGAFLAQDLLLFVLFFDLMLIPFYFLFGGWGAGDRADRVSGDDQDDRLHADRLAADAGRRDRDRGAQRRRRRRAQLLDRDASRARPAARLAAVDLLVLRGRLPGQDAGLPRPRLDAGRLPGRAAAGAGAAQRRPLQGRAPTASSASSCRSSPTRRSSTRRSC